MAHHSNHGLHLVTNEPDDPCSCAPSQNERRHTNRQRVDDYAIIRLIDLALDIPGRILDISLGGCCIHTERRFPLGVYRRVETEFRIEGLPFRLAGVTQSIHDAFHVGIRFLDMSDRKREQLVQLIAEIVESEHGAQADPEGDVQP